MKTTIKKHVALQQPALIAAIQQLVAIPSVIAPAKPGAPFGEPIAQALAYTLALCERFGFETKNCGEYGYADIGSGTEMLGILGHLDVVPVGDLAKWESNPFVCELIGDKLIGRGTQDDKGPTLAALFAVKALLDSGVEFKKKIRFIFGTDEESLWRDMAKYRANGERIPDFGFTPDASFPMIHAEKGLLQVRLTTHEPSPIQLEAGMAFNSVPDQATYTGAAQAQLQVALQQRGFEFVATQTATTVLGKAVHAQAAGDGKNAISRLALALSDCGLETTALKFISEVIGEDAHGEAIIPNCQDEITGRLTLNLGKITLDATGQALALDLRIPVSYDKADIVHALQAKAAQYGLTYTEIDWLAPIHVPLEHQLIQTLRSVYEAETGLDSTPQTSGGATYARALDNCVAFGMVFPTSAKTEHQPNEYITLTDLAQATNIYAQAIYELVQADA